MSQSKTAATATAVVADLLETGKNLTYVYVTHDDLWEE